MADQLIVTQGSLAERRFVAAYGYQGRIIAADGLDQGRWMGFYQRLIGEAAPLPPAFPVVDRRPEALRPVPAESPTRRYPATAPPSPSPVTHPPNGGSSSLPSEPNRQAERQGPV